LSSRVDQYQWKAFGLPPPIDSIEESIMIHVANIPPSSRRGNVEIGSMISIISSPRSPDGMRERPINVSV
jgi:hypothetical protein